MRTCTTVRHSSSPSSAPPVASGTRSMLRRLAYNGSAGPKNLQLPMGGCGGGRWCMVGSGFQLPANLGCEPGLKGKGFGQQCFLLWPRWLAYSWARAEIGRGWGAGRAGPAASAERATTTRSAPQHLPVPAGENRAELVAAAGQVLQGVTVLYLQAGGDAQRFVFQHVRHARIQAGLRFISATPAAQRQHHQCGQYRQQHQPLGQRPVARVPVEAGHRWWARCADESLARAR